jgi:hypothetical protein
MLAYNNTSGEIVRTGSLSTGNVGIGTTSPTSKLHIVNNFSQTNPAMIIQSQDPGNGPYDFNALRFNMGSYNHNIGMNLNLLEIKAKGDSNFGTMSFKVGDGSLEALRIQNDGNVGIGTTAPAAKLDVSGNSRFSGNISFPTLNTRIDAGGLNDLNAFVFDQSRGQLINSTSNLYFNMDTNNDDTSRVIQFATNRSSSTGGNVIMTMTEDGNVGIGTNSPAEKLDVNGNINCDFYFGNVALAEGLPSGGSSNWTVDLTNIYNSNSGNVGIGISNPSAILHVNSAVNATTTPLLYLQTPANSVFPFTKEFTAIELQYGTDSQFSPSKHQVVVDSNTLIFKSQGLSFTNGRMNFLVGDGTTQSLHLASSGNVGIGTTSPGYQLELSLDSAFKPTTNTWTTTSDRRLKENIETANIDRCYEIVNHLDLKRYTWKDEFILEHNVEDHNRLGWIADEVEEYFPKAIHIGNKNGIEDLKMLNVDQIYAVMYGAIKKLIHRVDELETEINLIKNNL